LIIQLFYNDISFAEVMKIWQIILNAESGWMWEESVMAWIRCCPWLCLEGLRKLYNPPGRRASPWLEFKPGYDLNVYSCAIFIDGIM